MLRPSDILDHCWEQASHDLITGLPPTATGFGSIAVFVDCLSKHIVLVPTVKTIVTAEYARLFLDNVYRFWSTKDLVV